MARIVAFTYDRAIDRRILLECDTLRRAGHEVTIVAPDFGGVDTAPGIQRLPATPVRAGRVFRLRHTLENRWPTLIARLRPWLRPLAWVLLRADPVSSYLSLFQPALGMKADLYIAHDLPMLPVACEAASRNGGKVAYDSHELFPEREISRFEKRMWRRLEEKYIHRAALVIIPNPSAAQFLKERYGLADVLVIENREWLPATLPPREKSFHRAFGLSDEARVLLYQGGLSAGRNLESLVGAMAFVSTPDLHLVFLGTGDIKEALKRRAQKSPRVHFHDAVAQEELLRFSMAADAGVVPYQPRSLNHKLCTPNKLYEFVIAGLPIAATDLPELRRLVGGHGLGVLGDTSSARVFAALIDRLFAPETFAQAQKSVANARALLSWQQQEGIFAQRIGALLADSAVDSARASA